MTGHTKPTLPASAVTRCDPDPLIAEIDQALDASDHPSPDAGDTPAKLSAITRLPAIMRWVGAIAVVTAAVLFMLQGIHSITFMTRHWIFLGVTAGLGMVGLLLGLRFKETRGARTFLGLAVASLPVLFSQLGGMIHSLLGVAPSTMPSVFVIQAEAPASIALTGLVTLAITIPLVSLGFMVLARPRALALTVAHFVMNACILIPGREPELVGPLLLVMTIALYLVDTRLLRNETALRSLEGRFSRLMLVAPIAVMLVRTMFFSVNMLYAGSIFFSVGFALFYTARDWPVTEGAQRLGQAGGTAMLVAGWGLAAMWFLPTAWLPDALEVLVLLIPATGILVGVSVKTVTVADGRVYRTIGGIVATAAVVIAHAVGTSPWVSVVSVCCGALLAVLGLYLREKGSFYAGCFSGLAGIIGGAWSAISFDAAMLWAVPAVLGLLVLTAASVLEIKKDGIARLIRRWHTTWEPRDQDATRVETATGRTMS